MVQTRWASILDPLTTNPVLNGIVLKQIELTTGLNTINHKLGRKLQGWLIVRKRASSDVYDVQDANTMPQLTLQLQASAPASVDIYVYQIGYYMSVTNSPNMNLPIPVVGDEAGPQYAIDIDSCLNTIDGHDHTSGSGVQITSSAININADLPFNSHNATLLRSSRFVSQGSPINGSTDLNCLSVSGVDLYYRDGSGNIVRITQSGGVAGSPGSIANLTSPASASYVALNGTFVWQSAALTAANMDFASAIFRNSTASSFGVTVQPPTLASDYSLTLPTVPGATSFLTIDATGVIGPTIPIAQGIATSMIADSAVTTAKIANLNVTTGKLADGAVTTSKITDNAVTYPKLVASNNTASGSSGNFVTQSVGEVAVTNNSTSINASGVRPIMVVVTANSAGGGMTLQSNTNVAGCRLAIYRDGVQITAQDSQFNTIGAQFGWPLSIQVLDRTPSAGVHTYELRASVNTISTVLGLNNIYISAIEI